MTTWLSYLWVRKYLRVYIDIIASSRRTCKPCWWRYFVTYMTMMIHSFSISIRLLRVGPYCNYNGLYYYSSERVTRAGWELLTIYLRWNPLTRSLAILLMRFSTWWTVCSTTRVVSCDAFIFGRVIAHVQQLLPNAYQRPAYMLPIQHKASPIYTWLHCVVPFVHNVMDMQLMLYAHLLGNVTHVAIEGNWCAHPYFGDSL